MQLSAQWIDHSPDLAKCARKAKAIRAEPTCTCGVTERHEHCGGCGKLLSKGDWAAPPIATFVLKIR